MLAYFFLDICWINVGSFLHGNQMLDIPNMLTPTEKNSLFIVTSGGKLLYESQPPEFSL